MIVRCSKCEMKIAYAKGDKPPVKPLCPVCDPDPVTKKRIAIREYADRFGIRVLVETGTNYGETLEKVKDCFDELHSIELNRELWEKAKERFKIDRKIHLYCGDSGIRLEFVIDAIKKPCLFWIDAHLEKEGEWKGKWTLITPIEKELKAIFDHPIKNHVILIDDMRCFVGKRDYPNIEEIKRMSVEAGYKNCHCQNDMIFIHN